MSIEMKAGPLLRAVDIGQVTKLLNFAPWNYFVAIAINTSSIRGRPLNAGMWKLQPWTANSSRIHSPQSHKLLGLIVQVF